MNFQMVWVIPVRPCADAGEPGGGRGKGLAPALDALSARDEDVVLHISLGAGALELDHLADRLHLVQPAVLFC